MFEHRIERDNLYIVYCKGEGFHGTLPHHITFTYLCMHLSCMLRLFAISVCKALE